MKPSTFSDHTIPQSTGPHIPCVHSCDCIFHILCTNIDSINNGQARAHSQMQWTSHRCLSNQLWGLACKQPCLQPRPDQPLDTYHLFFPIKYFSFVSHYLFGISFYFFWEPACKQHCIWPRSNHLDQPATKASSTFSDQPSTYTIWKNTEASYMGKWITWGILDDLYKPLFTLWLINIAWQQW